QGPVEVLPVEAVVAGLVHLGIDHGLVDQEQRPLVVAVPAQQGVVEVEQREVHRRSASRRSGSVIARWVRSEYRSSASSIATRLPMSRAWRASTYSMISSESLKPRPAAW